MDVMNALAPMPNAGVPENQSKSQTNVDAGKNGKQTDVFTNVLHTVVDQKGNEGQPKELQGNMTAAMSKLTAALVATINKGLAGTVSGENQAAEVVKTDEKQLSGGKTDSVPNAQTLAAIMALLGAQTPQLAQNGVVASVGGTAVLGENVASNPGVTGEKKAKENPFPFNVLPLQGKVLPTVPSANDNTSGVAEAGKANILSTVLQKNTELQQAQNMVQPDMNAAKVQIVNQMTGTTTRKPGQTDVGLKTDNSTSDKVAETKKIGLDAVNVLSAVQPITEKPVLADLQATSAAQTIAANTGETVKNVVDSLLQSETKKEQGQESSDGKSEQQPIVFSNILMQHTEKPAHQGIQPQGMQKAKDTYDVAGQIIEQAKLFKQPFDPNNSEMLIKLRPEHLGEMTLKVAVDNGVVTASFHTNNAEVRGIIEASLPQLKQDMANQGLKVDNVGVYAGLGDFFSNSQQGELFRQQQQQQQSGKLKNVNVTEDFIQAVEGKSLPQVAGADGVDYRI